VDRRLLAVARAGRDVCWAEADDEHEPLVTVRIPTYNRGPLIAERAIASAVAQTYERLEILVVGDACDRATADAVERFDDPRVRFVNLPARGLYPADPALRWLVAGTSPVNVAMDLARGAWIAPCDDDDELTPDHVETLLGAARANRLEMVWSKARMEVAAGQWGVVGNGHFAEGFISHGSVMFSAGLRFMRYRGTCWKLGEPGDWNLWKRMADAGVRIGFVDAVTYVHYLETPKREEAAA
jgi:glycosyltransferase involved in cell wall biosynthesis